MFYPKFLSWVTAVPLSISTSQVLTHDLKQCSSPLQNSVLFHSWPLWPVQQAGIFHSSISWTTSFTDIFTSGKTLVLLIMRLIIQISTCLFSMITAMLKTNYGRGKTIQTGVLDDSGFWNCNQVQNPILLHLLKLCQQPGRATTMTWPICYQI